MVHQGRVNRTPTIRPRGPAGARAVNRWLAGWTLLVLLFLYLPILVLAVYSFNASRLNILWTGFTLHWYAEVWSHRPLLQALQNSLVIALAATAGAVVLGTVGAWALRRPAPGSRRALRTLVAIPMLMPEVIMGISFLVFFAAVAFPLGFTTVIIAHITFCFPFVLTAVQARLAGLDPALEEAALDLGATRLGAFWLVVIPGLRPALVAGALMAFTLSMDEVIVTYFTASPASTTLPLRIFGLAKVGLNPMLNALSALFIVATGGVVLALSGLQRRGGAR